MAHQIMKRHGLLFLALGGRATLAAAPSASSDVPADD
jgi:hypothetical protein